MAVLRDKAGVTVYDREGNPVKTTTEGERKSRDIRAVRKKEKERIHKENAKARKKRSPEEQLQVLDERLGKGKGATKERVKLKMQIEERANMEKAQAEAETAREIKASQAEEKRKQKATR